MTNAEIVRDMSDDELAEFFGGCVGDLTTCETCMVSHLCTPDDKLAENCKVTWKKWMAQEIEEV